MNHVSSDLTFFVWSDTHLGYEQGFVNTDIRSDAANQMNALPGWPYPETIGGFVEKPEFILHCGDIVDGEKKPAGDIKFAYFRRLTELLKFPQYEVLGNQEMTGNNPQFMEYFLKKYGARSYNFSSQNISFIVLAGEYDENEQEYIPPEESAFLEKALNKAGTKTPIVLFQHSPLDSIRNKEDVLTILKKHNVILSMAGHKHRPAVFEIEGIRCVTAGHCRNHPADPVYGRNFYVVHISEETIKAVPWRWDIRDWERGQGWSRPDDTAKQLTLNAKWR